jgi:hypothetical protein
MSPTDAGRFSDAATLANLVEEAITTPACDEDTSKLDDDAGKGALATEPWPPRPVKPARVALSRNAHPRPYNDPSNYLG